MGGGGGGFLSFFSFLLLLFFWHFNNVSPNKSQNTPNNNNNNENRHNINLYIFYADVGFSLWLFFLPYTHTHLILFSVHFFYAYIAMIVAYVSLLFHFFCISPQLTSSPHHIVSLLILRSKQTKWIGNMIHLYYPFYGATNNAFLLLSIPWQKELHRIYAMLLDCQIYTHIFSLFFLVYFVFLRKHHFTSLPPCRPSFFNALFFFRFRRKICWFFLSFFLSFFSPMKNQFKKFPYYVCVCVVHQHTVQEINVINVIENQPTHTCLYMILNIFTHSFKHIHIHILFIQRRELLLTLLHEQTTHTHIYT